MKARIFLLYSLLLTIGTLGTTVRIHAQSPIHIGIIGDSNTDEYRGDDNRGGAYGQTTFNWLELLVRYRGIDAGAWSCRAEPRRCGYEFNWSRSGATARSMITSGQHTGLAQQVRTGKVTHAIVWIGTNDFSPTTHTYDQIYNGSVDDSQLETLIASIIRDITTAVDTVLAAKRLPMILVSIGDPGQFDVMKQVFPDSAKRYRVTRAIDRVNQGIRNIAADKSIQFVDFNDWSRAHLTGNYILVGGERIETLTFDDEPHHVVMSDRHIGTVVNALLANLLFIQPMNTSYGTSIGSFSEYDALRYAGITTSEPTPTPTTPPAGGSTPTPPPTCQTADMNCDGCFGSRDLALAWLSFVTGNTMAQRIEALQHMVTILRNFSAQCQ